MLNILIVGAGCAGPALAFWLVRSGHRVTIVERFPSLRTGGAQIDLRAQGIQLAKRMGIIDTIRTKVVDEDGMAWVDRRTGKAVATLLANKSGKGAQTFSSEFEIMRGDLVRILYDVTKDDVEYIFGTTVERFEQDDKGVVAHFSDGKSATYDILVGADGQGSHIRSAILPPGVDPLRHLGVYTAYWEVPTVPSDNKIAKLSHIPGSRMIMTRTHSPEQSQAIFSMREDSEEMGSIPKASIERQKEFWAARFKNDGWAAPRLIEGMQTSDYFYCQELVQVRSDTWYRGRVVLLADAAHCPSPLSGMGTTSALVGAYVLAGEISQNADDLDKAFANYDKTLRPFINEIQTLPGWVVKIFLPKTQFMISLLYLLGRLAAFLRLDKLAQYLPEGRAGWEVPEYASLVHVDGKMQ